jgi:hypothetical protein
VNSGVGAAGGGVSRYVRVGAVVATLWTAVLVILLLLTGDGLLRVIGGLGTILTGLGAVVQQRQLPRLDRKVATLITVAVLAVDALGTVSWLGWRAYQENQPIDVTAQLSLDQNIDVRPGGHAVLDADIPGTRTQIVLIFDVVDHNGEIGSCLPNTLLYVTPDTAGNRGTTRTVTPGEPVTLLLASHARHLHLDILISNVRDDTNCSVDVSVSSAKLTNG